VAVLERLLSAMLPKIDLQRALLRGRYMWAAAAMERNGVPVDLPTLQLLRRHWTDMQDDLIAGIDSHYAVFEGRTFKQERWERFLVEHNIPWPRLESGRLDMEDDTFRQMAKAHPEVAPMRELRSALSELRLNDLAVGSDGRNRCLLSAFASYTGRNQPSNSRFIFGPSVWLRSLIKSPPGHGLVLFDWSQQEFGIAAALSKDSNMMAAYKSGDPYMTFAQLAGAIPAHLTKQDIKGTPYEAVRELYKQCVLAVQYGMQERSLASRIGQPVAVARELLQAHRETFRDFWNWTERVLEHAMLTGDIFTTFGWHARVGANPNPRAIQNFRAQGNGAEMLRLACCLAVERGLKVVAPIHDAVMIEVTLERLDADADLMEATMAEASRVILPNFELATDRHVIKYPERFQDPKKRGNRMWQVAMQTLANRGIKVERVA
jgi:DNA polymerase-1